jgi:hypothetical protein
MAAPWDQQEIEANPLVIIPQIGDCLRHGWLNLFLGAGVSKPFGLPMWHELVASILDRGNDAIFIKQLESKSDKELGKLVDSCDDGTSAYVEKVWRALYANVPVDLRTRLTSSPLLLAVTALMTGKVRGRVERIYTYNYDNFIEEYLRLLGYEVCVRKQPDDLSGRSDVEINHVHGYLPRAELPRKPPELILSAKSYRNRRVEIFEGWSMTIQESLMSKSALVIGMSGNDDSILDVFLAAKRRVEKYHNHLRHDKKLGFWLVSPRHYKINSEAILEVGMCPVPVSKEDLPEFILRICQIAMQPDDESTWKLPLSSSAVRAENGGAEMGQANSSQIE